MKRGKDNEFEASAGRLEALPIACQRAGVLIERLLAGAASGTERAELAGHLAACADCRQYSEDAQALSNMFRGIRLRYPEAPAEAGRPAVSRRGRLAWLRWSFAAAAALVLAVGAGYLFLRPTAPAGAPPPAHAGLAGEPDAIAEHLGIGLGARGARVEAMAAQPDGLVGGPAGGRYPSGLLVLDVQAGSWAERVGIQPRDRILEAAGVSLEGEAGRWALGYMLRSLSPGGSMPLSVWRDGRVFSAVYRHGER